MSELKPCQCDLNLLNDRILNLGAGLATMPENGTMQVSKAFLTAIVGYMEELLGMRRAKPANEPLTLKQPEMVRCKDCKYFTDKGVCTFYSVFKNDGSYLSMQFMDDDDFCSYGERKDGDSNDE